MTDIGVESELALGKPGRARPHGGSTAVRAAAAVGAVATLGLFGRIMSYPLQHDEQFYLPAGALFTVDTLYPQLGFSHLPNLPILLHLLFALPIDAHYLLVGRLLVFAAWIGSIAALFLLGRDLAHDWRIGAAMAALLMTNTLLLGPTGMAATNNFVPVPFLLVGLITFLRATSGANDVATTQTAAGKKAGLLLLSGFLLAVAGGFKANYAVLVMPFAVAAVIVPRGMPLRQRLRRVTLPFACGCVFGALPTLYFLVRDPRGFLVHIFEAHRGPQIAYWLAHPDPLDPKVMSLRAKMLLAQQTWFSAGTMTVILALAFFGILAARAPRPAGMHERSDPIWLILAVTLLAGLVSLPPTPAFPQYYALPIPFGIALLAALYARIDAAARVPARAFLAVAVAVGAVAGAPLLLAGTPAALVTARWSGNHVHADAVAMADLVSRSRSAAPVATLAPLFALEGGKPVLPQLGLGPFIYRAAAYMTPAQRLHFQGLLTPETIEARLRTICPAAVLVGFEGALEAPLAGFAARQHYRPSPFILQDADRTQVLLLVRPPSLAHCA